MLLPSFKNQWIGGVSASPRILVLQVHPKEGFAAEPLTHVIIEREERQIFNHDGTLSRAELTFSYEELKPFYRDLHTYKNQFHASFTAWGNKVSLTTHGSPHGLVALDLELKGHRIGTYFFSQIVEWAQRSWPDASVNTIELLRGQAYNQARRNRFYERYAIVFDSQDNGASGKSRDMRVCELTPVDSWKQNIREIGMMDYLAGQLETNESLSMKAWSRQSAVDRLEAMQDRIEKAPLRWALSVILMRSGRWLPIVLGLALVAAAIWQRV